MKRKQWDQLRRSLMNSEFDNKYIPLVGLNFLQIEPNELVGCFPAYLKLFGLNSQNIADFNSAFMKFGVKSADYSKLYERAVENGFSSLNSIDKQDFIRYCEFIFAF